MKKSLLSIGIGLVLVGVGPFISVEYEEYAHNWTPLDVQVVLKPGEFRSPEFKTDLDGRYLLSLATDQLSGPDLKREQCLMGVHLPRTVLNCDEVGKSVEFDWQVVSDTGNTIKMGSYAPLGISSSKINFGEFNGRGNFRQNLILRIQRDAGDLNSHHPRLVVEAGPESWEALPNLQLFSLLWAGGVGVLAFLVFLLPPMKFGRPNDGSGGWASL
jgi:hypothetical protein